MSFTSLSFILFFALSALLYYLLPPRARRYLLLCANYVFYMWWRPAFGALILAGTLVAYFSARACESELWGRRRLWPALGVTYTIGVLFVFKYLDFFLQSAAGLLGLDGGQGFSLLLPVGISFFTFSVAGYLFDVYRGKLAAERDFVDFAVFVSFFPTILAGPIGRAREFLPQLKTPAVFDGVRVKRGLLRFVWGAAKKLVLADTLGILVNTVYADASAFSPGLIFIALCAYSLQIYFDFAAYSDMAIGTADALGLTVMENFNAPYLSRSVKEFWKKWHISLTSWLREYLYFPLGGSRRGKARTYLNVLIVFAVSGLWHGANYTFIVWGLMNGGFQVLGELTLPARKELRTRLHIAEDSRLLALWQCLVTFLLMTAAWTFFRADSLTQAGEMLARVLSIPLTGIGVMDLGSLGLMKTQAIMLAVYFLIFALEDVRRASGRERPALEKTNAAYWGVMLLLALTIVFFGVYGSGFDPLDFVYFKF